MDQAIENFNKSLEMSKKYFADFDNARSLELCDV